jgi:hypothetical protein
VLHRVVLRGQIARQQAASRRLRLAQRDGRRGGEPIDCIAQGLWIERRNIRRLAGRKIILQRADVGHDHRLADRRRFQHHGDAGRVRVRAQRHHDHIGPVVQFVLLLDAREQRDLHIRRAQRRGIRRRGASFTV